MPTPTPAGSNNSPAEPKPTGRGNRRDRSTNYPAHTIQEAVAKAEAIYKNEKRSPVSADIAAQHLGFKNATNGSAAPLISSLRKYGILDNLPNGEVRISEEASLLFIYDPISPEHREALKRLAMKPPIFGEVLKKFPGGLPSDLNLRAKLQHEFGFASREAADTCIRALRAAISVDAAAASGENSDVEAHPKEGVMPPVETIDRGVTVTGKTPSPPSPHHEKHVWKLGDGVWAEVAISGRLNPKFVARLKQYVELLDIGESDAEN